MLIDQPPEHLGRAIAAVAEEPARIEIEPFARALYHARRAKAYADAGADGIFVPGLTDLALIEKFIQLTPLPVNMMHGVPEIPDLARVGVRRVSLGPWPMMAAMRVVGQAAAAVAASKRYGTFLQPNAC
jgi:2-methylisocitrate lyase-like PEP mutase family enzyme